MGQFVKVVVTVIYMDYEDKPIEEFDAGCQSGTPVKELVADFAEAANLSLLNHEYVVFLNDAKAIPSQKLMFREGDTFVIRTWAPKPA